MSVDVKWKNLKQENENAVVYCRYSSHSQGEQSIEGQLAAAHTYADAHGYNIIHEYVDRAQTGRNDNRDEFQQMLSDTAKKQFSVIIVWKVDRFGRNREEITFNKHRCKQHGVRVEYVAENLPDSPEAVILESVLEGMAEYYSLQLSQNIKRGYRENAKKGKYCGGSIPLGYKLDEEKRFVIDPQTAPIVKMIFEMYARGQTITEISAYLNGQGITTTAGRPFTKNSLRSLLKNEKYIGNIVYKNGEVRVDGCVPPITDQETFDAVQKMLQVNRRAPAHKWTRADYILSGKLFCGLCGSPMVGESGTSKTGAKHNYYACVAHKRNGDCKMKAIRQNDIENYILDQIRLILTDDELLNYIVDRTWAYYLQQKEANTKLKALKNRLADIDKSINNLMRAIEAGIFNSATKDRMDELDAQRTAITTAIAKQELQNSVTLTRNHLVFVLTKMRDLAVSDEAAQKRLIETFVNSIYVYPDKITIFFNYSEDGENATITLSTLDGTEASEFGCCASGSTRERRYELYILTGVFALTIKH